MHTLIIYIRTLHYVTLRYVTLHSIHTYIYVSTMYTYNYTCIYSYMYTYVHVHNAKTLWYTYIFIFYIIICNCIMRYYDILYIYLCDHLGGWTSNYSNYFGVESTQVLITQICELERNLFIWYCAPGGHGSQAAAGFNPCWLMIIWDSTI